MQNCPFPFKNSLLFKKKRKYFTALRCWKSSCHEYMCLGGKLLWSTKTWSPGFIMTFRETVEAFSGLLASSMQVQVKTRFLTWSSKRIIPMTTHLMTNNLHTFMSMFFSSSILHYAFFVESISLYALMSTKKKKKKPLAEADSVSCVYQKNRFSKKKKKNSFMPICNNRLQKRN